MAETLGSRLKNAWNVFMNRDPTKGLPNGGEVSYYRPDRPRLTRGNERSIVTSVINRIAMDAAAINIRHAQLDGSQRYLRDVDSGLNRCLNLEANVDQTGRALRQDIYMSMMDEGCVAVVPVETNDDPDETDGYEILSLRTGKITAWMPQRVRVRLYDERTGKREEVTVPKKTVAIIENPLYAVMNEPNSTMQRLMRKLALLDVIDEQNSSGKLDLIIQLPYVIKTEARRQQAENRRKDIEQQLAGSKYGIAYTDGTEKITQLNRSVENNLMAQIEYLTSMLYSQLGITKEIMDGTATEEVMLNYNNRTIEPLVSAVADEMKRKFLTKTARAERDQENDRRLSEAQREISVGASRTAKSVRELRHRLKRMSKEEKTLYKGKIKAEIRSLREENARERARIQYQLAGFRKVSQLRYANSNTRAREEAESRYTQEMEKIQGEAGFRKASKRKKS